MTYRVVPESTNNFFLIIQSKTEFDQPDKGLIGQHALYDPAAIETPEPRPNLDDHREWEVRIKVEDEYSKVFYPWNPDRCRGMEGRSDGVEDQHARYPARDEPPRPSAAERPHDIRDRRSGGLQFLPRPLEQDPEALKVPFFHSNTDYDEFLFYHDGDFFSRDNIRAGMATLHPRGIHHGPHPKALANQGKKSFTDESAVMLDGLNPIHVLPAGEQVEWKEYWASWMEKK